MTTSAVTIKIPSQYTSYLNDSFFQKSLSEFIAEYATEAKQDKHTIQKLAKNKKFHDLNDKLDKKLWSL